MATTNSVSVSAVPFNPQTQSFGSTQNVQSNVPTAAQNLAAFNNTQLPKALPVSTIGTDPIKLPEDYSSKINSTDYASFKAANPGQQFDAEDYAQYQASGKPINQVANMLQQYQVPDSDNQKLAQGIGQNMYDLLPHLMGQAQELDNQQKAQNLPQLKQNLTDLNNQVLQKQAELNQDDVQLAAGLNNIEKQAIPMQFITGQQQSVQRDAQIARALKSSEIGILNAQAMAAQGNIALAQQTAQDAVDLKFAPYKEAIQVYQQQLTALQPLLASDEKKQAAQQQLLSSLALKQVDAKVANQKQATDLYIQAAAIAPPDVLSRAKTAINNGADATEVATILDKYGGKDYLTNQYMIDSIKNQSTSTPGQVTIDNGYTLDDFKKGIAGVESSNNYNAIGPATSSGDKAYGKYQVLGSNIPSWTQEAGLGRMTPQQFLASPDAQEKVFEFQSSKNYAKYQNWGDVASVWFSGKPLPKNTASDGYNTVPQYVQKVLGNMGVNTNITNTPMSVITNPDVVQWGTYLQQNPDKINEIPKNLQTQALMWKNSQVVNDPKTDGLVGKINQIDNIISNPALSAVVGPNIKARAAPDLGSYLGRVASDAALGSTVGAGAGAIAGSPFFGAGAIPGAIGGGVAGAIGGTLLSAGSNAIASIPYFTGSAQNFLGDVNQLTKKETLDALVNLKQQGGTLGALSDSEGNLLRESATKIGSWEVKDSNGNVYGYNIDEKDFIKELNTIKTLAQKAVARSGGNALGGTPTDIYANSILTGLLGATQQAEQSYGYSF